MYSAWYLTPNLYFEPSTEIKKWTTYNPYKIQCITVLTFLLLYSNLLCILTTENSRYLQHEYSLFLCQHITTLRRMVGAYRLICHRNNIISNQIQILQVLATFTGTFLFPWLVCSLFTLDVHSQTPCVKAFELRAQNNGRSMVISGQSGDLNF